MSINNIKAKAINRLWKLGQTSWLLHKGQEKIEDQLNQVKNRLFVVECSRQFGKTYWGVYKADSVARQNPKCQIKIATAFYTDLHNIIIPAFRTLFETCPDANRPKYYEQKGKYIYPNGAEIQLVGLDKNPDKLRGTRLKLILVEEAGFADSEALEYAYTYVITPAMIHEPEAKIILISTPPASGNDHYFCQLADKAALEGSYVKLTIYDNPMLSEARIEEIAQSLGGKESIAFRRECLCERIVDTTRAIIPEFIDSFHCKTTVRPDYFRFLHTYASLDSGVRDMTVILLGYYDFPRATLVIEDEIVLSGPDVTTRNIREKTVNKEQSLGYLDVYRRIADNNNLILIQDLAGEGLSFTPTNKDSLEAMVNKVRQWFKDKRVEINPRCQILLGTLKSGLWNKNRDNFTRSSVYGHCDALAALMYLIRNIDVYTNPIPDYYLFPSNSSHWIKPTTKQTLSDLGTDITNLFKRRK